MDGYPPTAGGCLANLPAACTSACDLVHLSYDATNNRCAYTTSPCDVDALSFTGDPYTWDTFRCVPFPPMSPPSASPSPPPPSIPPTPPTPPASFTSFTSGASCEANGAGSITTLADCSAAGAALGLGTTAVDDGQNGAIT